MTDDPEGLARAREALAQSELVVYPTDTLYGLGCRASDGAAFERLRKLKGLPEGRGVSLVFATIDEARGWTEWTPEAGAIADAFLPGPVTLILDAAEGVPGHVLADEGTIGVRHVDRPATLALARLGPVVSTSANRHGEPNVTTADEARDVFGDGVAAYVDAGELTGPASTVVDARSGSPTVIREGPVSEAKIQEALKRGR